MQANIEEVRGTIIETWVKVSGEWWLVHSPHTNTPLKATPSREATTKNMALFRQSYEEDTIRSILAKRGER